MSNLFAQNTMGDDEPNDQHDDVDIIEELQVEPKNVEDECKCGSERCQQLLLSRELDTILDPGLTFRSPAQYTPIWNLFVPSPEHDVSSFLNLLLEYRAERHCGTAWLQDFVAYRCRTCSDSPNMAICADCFKNGNHQGHDYNMFKSGSGGACDCGFDIVKESGHCSRHGQNATALRGNENVPESLICLPKRMMPRLIHRLAMQLRKSLTDINVYLDCLMQIANSSAVLRSFMIEALISEEVYSSQINVLSNQVGNKQSTKIFKDGLKYLEHERKCLKPFKVPKEWRPPNRDINAFCDNVPIACFIDELVFWMIVYELPEKLVCFLLSLLMDDNYRFIFARSFVRNYPRILLTLIGLRGEQCRLPTRESYDKLSRRILHVSVQLYCHLELTRKLCDEEYVLHTIIYCLRAAIEGTQSDSGVLEPNRLCPPTRHMPMVVNTEGALIRDRHLRSFTGNLYDILACENEVFRLLNDTDLLNTWLEMLSNFQTMNPFKRELTEHTPFENGPHMSVFAVEADFCHSPMWSLLSCLKKDINVKSSQSLLSALHTNLSRWFYSMGIGPNSLLDPYHMSFHIPLHRMFASTLRNMMFTQKVSDQDLHKFISCNQNLLGTQYSYRSASGLKTPITFSGFVKMLLLHPLQALTLYNEIRNTMWTRNGISIINQAITYVHCACSFSTVDLDMFLLKYSASKLNPNYFIKTLLSRFHVWKWLSFKSNILMNDSLEEVRQLYHFNILPEQVISMIESSQVTLIQLLTLSIYCNVSEKEQTKQEMIALISVIDRSYSYLLNMLPDRGGINFGSANQDFVSLLDELTTYKPAQHGSTGSLQQGSYTLKSNIWDLEYDPIQVLYRFYQKRDYQMSLERYFQHAKLTGKLDRRYHPSTLWPPLKIPRNLGLSPQHLNLNPLFECQTLIGMVFTIIHKNLYYIDVPDSIMAYTIHLFELSLRTCLLSSSSTLEDKEATIDPSFNGRYCLKELSSCPAYFGSKDESNIKGNTIFSVPGDNVIDGYDVTNADDRLFPVVKNALDLGFESTWFPFVSVLENCLVHIENVHLLPWREFETLLESQQDPESKPDKQTAALAGGTATTTARNTDGGSNEGASEQVQNSDAEMYWSEQEYDETGIEEMIDDIDPDDDDDNDNDDDDDVVDNDDGVDNLEQEGGDLEVVLLDDNESFRITSYNSAGEIESTEYLRSRPQFEEPNLPLIRRLPSIELPLEPGQERRQSSVDLSTGQQANTPLMVDESLPESQSNALSLIPIRGSNNSMSGILVNSSSSSSTNSSGAGGDGGSSGGTSTGTSSSSTTTDNFSLRGSAIINNRPDQATQIYPENLVTTQRRALEAPEVVPMLEDSPQPLALEAPEAARRSAETTNNRTTTTTTTTPASGGSAQVGGANLNREEKSLSEMDIHARFVGFFQPRQEPHRSHLRGFRTRQVARRGAYRGPVTPLAVHNPNNNNNNNNNTINDNNSQTPVAYVTHPVNHSAAVAAVVAAAAAQNNNNNSSNNNNNNNNNISPNENEIQSHMRGVEHLLSQTATAGATTTATAAAAAAGAGGVGDSTTTTMMTTNSSSRDPRLRRATQCSCALLNRALSGRSQQESRQRRLRRDRMHHGESLLSLLLRLHAKYSRKANSYEYNEKRAKANLSPDRTRIGDGVHFVTIVLDLICQSNQRMLARIGQLQRLIWASATTLSNDKTAPSSTTASSSNEAIAGSGTTKMQLDDQDEEEEKDHGHNKHHEPQHRHQGQGQFGSSPSEPTVKLEEGDKGKKGSSSSVSAPAIATTQSSESGGSAAKVIPSTSLDPSERRRRAKEFQTRLMAEFANKQRAFMAKYESSQTSVSGEKVTGSSSSSSGGGCVGSGGGSSSSKSDKIEPDEEPINLSSKMSSSATETRPQMSKADKQHRPAASSFSSSVEKQPRRREQELTPPATDNSSKFSSSRNTTTGAAGSTAAADDPKPTTSSGSGSRPTTTATQDQQQKPTYECCICGSDSSSTDLTNPLGQVVLLQATSVYGHAHLRPRHERKLPCDDIEQLELQEETYAKYLARRIDLMCEHFCESSRLDTINIGAEGGVHVQSCGHYLHIECHQSYIKSLDQEDRPHARQDTDGFLCPVCRQLANSVLPILSSSSPSSSSSSSSSTGLSSSHPSTSESTASSFIATGKQKQHQHQHHGLVALKLEHQIKLIGSLLEHRSAPNQRELQSSASFCQHLTKATGSEYRRIKSEPNMHSLFLFLTSIARTNLETEVIMRSSKRRSGRGSSSSTSSSCTTTEASRLGKRSGSSSLDNTTSRMETSSDDNQQVEKDEEEEEEEDDDEEEEEEETAPRRRLGQRSGCFLLLFQVLALNSRTLIEDHWFTYDQLWAHLTHHADEKNRLSVKPMKRSEVPLLLRDPTAMLLQFLFAITDPKHLSYLETHFTCLVQMLFNLTVIQSIALVLSYIRPQDKARLGLDSTGVGVVVGDQQQQHQTRSHSSTSSLAQSGVAAKPSSSSDETVNDNDDDDDNNVNINVDATTTTTTTTTVNESSQPPNVRTSYDNNNKPIRSVPPMGESTVETAASATTASTTSTSISTSMATATTNQFSYLLASVLSGLSPLLLPTNEEPLLDQRVRSSRWSNELLMDGLSQEMALVKVENRTKLACLPFLRGAALIRHHLYGQQLPDLESLDDRVLVEPSAIEADFSKLIGYLQLGGGGGGYYSPKVSSNESMATATPLTREEGAQNRTFSNTKSSHNRRNNHRHNRRHQNHHYYHRLVDALNWPPGAQESLVSSWSAELLRFASEFSIAARSLLVCRPLAWHRPSLMQLPDSFDDIFLFYYRKECSLCHQVPKDVAICLVCGAPVCFRNGCCKARSGSRQLHSHYCGAGTAIFLAIQTSSIVVIRGNRACVWGSVYLDAHDEEDSGLQRGKPLHLVKARYRLLEDQWLTHTFDHTCGKRWIYLQEN